MPSARGSRAQSAKPSPSRLGINAVIDSTQQVVHFSRANLGLRIVERNGTTETDLWKLPATPAPDGLAEVHLGAARTAD